MIKDNLLGGRKSPLCLTQGEIVSPHREDRCLVESSALPPESRCHLPELQARPESLFQACPGDSESSLLAVYTAHSLLGPFALGAPWMDIR